MLKSIPPRVYIAAFIVLIVGLALCRKGDVKAAIKAFGIEFSIDAKDPASQQSH